MIDNYDSFTFNLVHYFRGIGQRVEVYRNDEITVADIIEKDPQYLVISPGPCSPNEAGISLQAIAMFAGKIPMLGVCLGHQCIAQHFGANIIKAKQPMHGKLSQVAHNNSGLFNALSQPLTVTRYHSLVVEPSSLPEDLIVTAKASYELTSGESTIANIEDKEPNENNVVQNQVVDNIDINYEHDEIMGLQHRSLPIHSVQFHPESILTEQGHQLLANFIDMYAK